MNYKEIIKNYIVKEMLDEHNVEINDDTELILNNLIDSLSVVRLLIFLEDTFEIGLDDELDLKNFSSLKNIYELINNKRHFE